MTIHQTVVNQLRQKIQKKPKGSVLNWSRSMDDLRTLEDEKGIGLINQTERQMIFKAAKQDMDNKTDGKNLRQAILKLIAEKYSALVRKQDDIRRAVRGNDIPISETNFHINQVLYAIIFNITQEVYLHSIEVCRNTLEELAYLQNKVLQAGLTAPQVKGSGKLKKAGVGKFDNTHQLAGDVELILAIANYSETASRPGLKANLNKAIEEGEAAINYLWKKLMENDSLFRAEVLSDWQHDSASPYHMAPEKYRHVLAMKASQFTADNLVGLSNRLKHDVTAYRERPFWRKLFGLVPKQEEQAVKLAKKFKAHAFEMMKLALQETNANHAFITLYKLADVDFIANDKKYKTTLERVLNEVAKNAAHLPEDAMRHLLAADIHLSQEIIMGKIMQSASTTNTVRAGTPDSDVSFAETDYSFCSLGKSESMSSTNPELDTSLDEEDSSEDEIPYPKPPQNT